MPQKAHIFADIFKQIFLHEAVLIAMKIFNKICSDGSSSQQALLSGVPDYFGRKWISSGGDLSHYSSASLY